MAAKSLLLGTLLFVAVIRLSVSQPLLSEIKFGNTTELPVEELKLNTTLNANSTSSVHGLQSDSNIIRIEPLKTAVTERNVLEQEQPKQGNFGNSSNREEGNEFEILISPEFDYQYGVVGIISHNRFYPAMKSNKLSAEEPTKKTKHKCNKRKQHTNRLGLEYVDAGDGYLTRRQIIKIKTKSKEIFSSLVVAGIDNRYGNLNAKPCPCNRRKAMGYASPNYGLYYYDE